MSAFGPEMCDVLVLPEPGPDTGLFHDPPNPASPSSPQPGLSTLSLADFGYLQADRRHIDN